MVLVDQVGGQWTGLGCGVEERYPGLSSDSGLNVWENDDLEKDNRRSVDLED